MSTMYKIWFFLVLILVMASGCSSSHLGHTLPNGELKMLSGKACKLGFIRPPGVKKCFNIQSLIDGKFSKNAPSGSCPDNWAKVSQVEFCLPTHLAQGCGDKTFACDKEPGDTMRVKRGIPKCGEAEQVVLVETLLFSMSGELFLAARPNLMCGPLDKVNPV